MKIKLGHYCSNLERADDDLYCVVAMKAERNVWILDISGFFFLGEAVESPNGLDTGISTREGVKGNSYLVFDLNNWENLIASNYIGEDCKGNRFWE